MDTKQPQSEAWGMFTVDDAEVIAVALDHLAERTEYERTKVGVTPTHKVVGRLVEIRARRLATVFHTSIDAHRAGES